MLAGPVIGTVLYALGRGVAMERISAATGLTGADLVQLDARLPERHMPALWRLLAETFPNQAIALEMASTVPLSFFGTLLHATRYAADLRAALRMLVRYRAVFSPRLHMALDEAALESRLRYHHPQDEDDDGHASELAIGLGVRYLKDILALRDVLLRIELSHPPLGPPAAYQAFFGAPVVFAATHNAVVYRPAALDRPLAEHDAPALDFLVAHLELVRERELARRINPELVPIRDAILRNAEAGEYDVEALARRLATTPRSLQRRVGALGTTPRALIDHVRERNARQLLSESRLPIVEIAFLLGYSSETSFRRAFRRWSNTSPGQLRHREASAK